MFSSLSARIFGQTPSKNSSPGPTRPEPEELDYRQFPSTAPAELEEPIDGLDDRHFSGMPSQHWGDGGLDLPLVPDQTANYDNDENPPDGITDYEPTPDGLTDYVDPFSAMMPFSTQAVLDDELDVPAYESDHDDGAKKKKKSKKGKKADEKESRKEKRKSKKKTADREHSDLALPTPTTSGPASHSGPEEVEAPVQPSTEDTEIKYESESTSNKKKRKRKQSAGSGDAQETGRKKKRKTRKPLEDIEDSQDVVPESPSNQLLPESNLDLGLGPAIKSEAHQSELISVARQLFQPERDTSSPAPSVSDQDDEDNVSRYLSDDDNDASLSSPSAAAQRRRSMSRGSQISALRQGLSRDSTSLPDKISEAAESADEASAHEDESAPLGEEPSEAPRSPSAASQQSLEDAEPLREPVFELNPDVDMAEASNEPLASGALVDDGESEAGDFADDLPPSSQPPREDTQSADGSEMDIDQDVPKDVEQEPEEAPEEESEEEPEAEDEEESEVEPEQKPEEEAEEEPRLPIRTFRDALNDASNSAKKLKAMKDIGREKEAATPRPARRRNVEAAADVSELSNIPSSARKSVRSTASKRQRSKPNFFDKEQTTVEDPAENEATDDEADEDLAVLSELPASDAAEPPKKTRNPKKSTTRTKTTEKTLANKTPAKKTPAKKAATTAVTPSQSGIQGNYKTGKFSVEELELLGKAVQRYRDEHGLTQQQMNNRIQMKNRNNGKEVDGVQFDGQQFREMWAVLCAAVPNRKRQKVINVTRQEFHNFKARGGGWTVQEDNSLATLYDKHNGSWVAIAAELSRHPNDCRDRYRNYVVCGQTDERRRWTEEEEQELVEAVVASLRRMARAPSLINAPLESLINWQTVSEMMGRKRSRLQCLKKFKSLNVELSPNEVLQSSQGTSAVTWGLEKARKQIRDMPPEAKYELVQAILDGAAGTEENIKWSRLVDVAFRRKWHRPTLKLLWYRLKKQVPKYKKKSVRDCARWLLEDAEANAPSSAKFLDGGDASGDSEDELMIVEAPENTSRRGKQSVYSAELVEESDASEDDETRLATNANSPSAQQQPSSPASERSLEDSFQATPSLQPAASQQNASRDPSPAKKRVRLSRGKSAKERLSGGDGDGEGDGEETQPPTPSQPDKRAIPDRLKEKKEAARQRITSGSRSRRVASASLQPESVQNSDVDEDMPPIRVPPSTQPSRIKAVGKLKLPRGNWARKTGSNVLPGEPVELTDEVMAQLEADSSRQSVDSAVNEAVAPPAITRKAKRRRREVEVAESPS